MTENNRMHAPRTFYCHELDIWNGVMHGSDRKQVLVAGLGKAGLLPERY